MKKYISRIFSISMVQRLIVIVLFLRIKGREKFSKKEMGNTISFIAQTNLISLFGRMFVILESCRQIARIYCASLTASRGTAEGVRPRNLTKITRPMTARANFTHVGCHQPSLPSPARLDAPNGDGGPATGSGLVNDNYFSPSSDNYNSSPWER